MEVKERDEEGLLLPVTSSIGPMLPSHEQLGGLLKLSV